MKINYSIFKILILVGFVALVSFSLVPIASFAAQDVPSEYKLLEPLPCISGEEAGCVGGKGGKIPTIEIQGYIVYAFNLFMALAAVAAVVMIVWGGLEYMTSDAWNKKSDGIGKLKNAVTGLLLVLTSYLFLQAINPKLVQIPVGLVPQLTIDASLFNSNKNFFDRLIEDADRYQVMGQEEVEKARLARAEVELLEQELMEWEDRLFTARINGDPNQTEIENKMQEIRNAIQSKKSDVVLDVTRSTMHNGAISQTLQDINRHGVVSAEGVYNSVQGGIDTISQMEEARTKQAAEIGAYEIIDEAGGIKDTANASRIELQLKGLEVVINTAKIQEGFWNTLTYGTLSKRVEVVVGVENLGTIPEANSKLSGRIDSVTTQISTIKDPQLKQNLENLAQNVRNQLNTKFNSVK